MRCVAALVAQEQGMRCTARELQVAKDTETMTNRPNEADLLKFIYINRIQSSDNQFAPEYSWFALGIGAITKKLSINRGISGRI